MPPKRATPPKPAGPPKWARAPPKWYLSFDCATKTFAFCLCRLDLAECTGLARARLRLAAVRALMARAQAGRDAACAAGTIEEARALLEAASDAAAAAAEAASTLAAELGRVIQIADGGVADLVPGVPDRDIPTVARIQAVVRYVADVVRPALERCAAGAPRRVVIEYQMGQNAPARVVAAALATLFADEDVTFVGPGLKNSLALCEEGRYSHFARRYKTNYDANKAHSAYNFLYAEKVFGTGVAPTTRALRGHIADSFMQVLGLLVNGPSEADSPQYF